jgi:hypothetical protein
MIKNECEQNDQLANELAKKIGYAERNSLYKFYNYEAREINFDQVLTLVRELFPEREFEIMSEYILTLKPTKECARESLEYASLNKLNELFEEMLNRLKTCKNTVSNEWAAVYQIFHDTRNGTLSKMDAIDKLNSLYLELDSIEMKVYTNIVKSYLYNEMSLVGILKETTSIVPNHLEQLKDSYVKNIYEGRYNSIMADVHLHDGLVNEVREVIVESLEKVTNNNLLSVLYHQIGRSYFFESYSKAIEYLEIGVKIAGEITKNNINKTINFLNSYWETNKDFIDVADDEESKKSDYGFHKIQSSKEEAINILELVNYEGFSDLGKGIHLFYLGKAKNDLKTLVESMKYFLKSNDKFFKMTTLIELEKKGFDPVALELLSI